MLAPMGLAAGPVVPTANGASSMRRSTAPPSPRSTPSTPPRSASSRRPAARSSAPRRSDWTARRLAVDAIGETCNVAADRARRRTPSCRRSAARSRKRPIKGRITLSGYEGSELLVARLLVESGADLRYVGTACPKTPGPIRREWLEAQGVRSVPRLAGTGSGRVDEFKPDLAIGTTPVVQQAKELRSPRSTSPT
jgi:chlorophyllide a reductase subunit Y